MTKNKERNFWIASFLVFLIDQVTKLLALKFLPLEDSVPLTKYISFTRVFNEATVMLIHELPFGISNAQFIFLWILSCVVITAGIWWVIKQPALSNEGWRVDTTKIGLFLILGSAWGNAFDRIFREGVVDFIQFNTFENIVPILNLADIMLYMGEFSLVVSWVLTFPALLNKVKFSILPKLSKEK